MGTVLEKTRCSSDETNYERVPVRECRRFWSFRQSEQYSEFSFGTLLRSLGSSSFGSYGSSCLAKQNENRGNRPWSRVSRRQWSEKTIENPLISSKTAWPVSLMESLFLPEFIIKRNILEESYSVVGSISAGAFGNVYKVLKKDDNKMYAMKVLSKSKIVANKSVKQVKDEVKIQQLVGHHPLIVNCTFFCQTKKNLFIISEFISGGELLTLLQEHGPLKLMVIKIYVAELAIVLDFLHNAGIIYRDLKPENILLDAENHIQIIDFGLSKWLRYGSRTNTLCGTLQYIAPEILQRQPYGHAADWWSLGIVLYWLLTGRCPFPCPVDEEGAVRQIRMAEFDDDARDLLQKLLMVDPARRLHSLYAIKRTPFFKDFDFENVHSMKIEV